MASDVDELQRVLDRTAKWANRPHIGASDRKHTLYTIKTMIDKALEEDNNR